MKKSFKLKNLITIIFVCTFFISKAQTNKAIELNNIINYAYVLDKTGDFKITKSELLTAEKLTTNKKNDTVKSASEIISFEMELVVNKKLVKLYSNNSYITPQMKKAIGDTDGNYKIYITNIVAKTEEGALIKLKEITIKTTN